jgi:DNA-binding transcriptional ArsR family regulator
MSLGDAPRRQAAMRAMAHPIRLQIMSLLTGAPLTAAEVARELGLTHANASYHLRNLLAGGMIVVAGEEKIRGGVAKRYRYDVGHDDQSRKAAPPWTDEQNRAYYASMANELIRRTADADVWVDPQVWRDITKRIGQAAIDLHNAARPPRTPGTVRTSTTVAMFTMQQPEIPGATS